MKRLSTIAVLICLTMNITYASAAEPSKQAVLDTYADIAYAVFQDSLITARSLQTAVNSFVAKPSDETLQQTREAWIAAREPYLQSEVYRFGNRIVDEWEGKVNSWPLDEGMIDYVNPNYGQSSELNPYSGINIIANPTLSIAGKIIDARIISPALISDTLQEIGGIEANVASGYHAIEFLLWGQDLNGTGPGAGNRPATDFDINNCTNKNCDRRIAYLVAVTKLLIMDLEEMVEYWEPGGDARESVVAGKPEKGLVAILTGMGSLSNGELAGERMKLGLQLHDPEEEHDCFSDNTHNSHFNSAAGIVNVYTGSYRRVNGTLIEGTGISTLVRSRNPALDTELQAKLDATMSALTRLKDRAEKIEAYDQMIGEGNEAGNATIQDVIDALIDQSRSIERVVVILDLTKVMLEGAENTDGPSSIFE